MYFDRIVDAFDQARRERNVFHDLMKYRVREVLLVGSLYDSYIVESDGVLADQIYGEYFKLNLHTVPRVTCAYTAEAALQSFLDGRHDLVIILAGAEFGVPLALARSIKEKSPDTPILLMVTTNTSLVSLESLPAASSAVDRVFVWNGYSSLFVAMIKYVEDLRNVESDTDTGLVRVILLVEDSIRYCSRYLPLLYQVVMRQTQVLIEEEKGDEFYKMLRSRARPKILLAESFEEAETLFGRFEPFVLAVITDLVFPRGGRLDEEAGYAILKMSRERRRDLPVLVQSTGVGAREKTKALGAGFIDKNSASLEYELGEFLKENLGFGPFRFRNGDGTEIASARTVDEFAAMLPGIPAETLLHHAARNHFSAWLMARGEIQFAKLLRSYSVSDFTSALELRDFLCRIFDSARRDRIRGPLRPFDESAWRDEGCLLRLGGGSVGGKGRGIIFVRSLLDNLGPDAVVEGLRISTPRSAFIGIDEFQTFLEVNDLWSFAYYGGGDDVRTRFLEVPLGPSLVESLARFLSAAEGPLAVRSSGLFEDMLLVPFSGIYETYLIPNSHPDPAVRLRQLCDAVRLVWASLFRRDTRNYFQAARYDLEEERMAVVIQELVGSRKGRWFYPDVSGVAQSHNWYPVSYMKPEDGLCLAAVGLCTWVVEGGESHRFCPSYPKLHVVPPEGAREESQRAFRAVDLSRDDPDLRLGEDAALAELPIDEAEGDPAFALLVSTWDAENDRLVPGTGVRGQRVADFSPILIHDALPFAKAMTILLDVCARAMSTPVEIEYSLAVDPKGVASTLYVLQIKPLAKSSALEVRFPERVDPPAVFLSSGRAMGNGRMDDIVDLLWVDPERFDRAVSKQVAAEIASFDVEIGASGARYVLIGPGRWGTRDPWLGIPVSFPQIAHARVIVETDLPGIEADFSFGSHFFHNLTGMNIGYLRVRDTGGEHDIDRDWLSSRVRTREGRYCVWTHLDRPLEILLDGRISRALILKEA